MSSVPTRSEVVRSLSRATMAAFREGVHDAHVGDGPGLENKRRQSRFAQERVIELIDEIFAAREAERS